MEITNLHSAYFMSFQSSTKSISMYPIFLLSKFTVIKLFLESVVVACCSLDIFCVTLLKFFNKDNLSRKVINLAIIITGVENDNNIPSKIIIYTNIVHPHCKCYTI